MIRRLLLQTPCLHWMLNNSIIILPGVNESHVLGFFSKSRARWPISFLDSPTMRNVLSGLCFYDRATDAQEPYCLARTHHRPGGGEGERAGDRQTERELSLFLSFCSQTINNKIYKYHVTQEFPLFGCDNHSEHRLYYWYINLFSTKDIKQDSLYECGCEPNSSIRRR